MLNIESALVLLALLAAVGGVIYAVMYFRSVSFGQGMNLDRAQQKGFEHLRKAYKKAQEILGKAELEGIKVVADTKVTTRALEERYKEETEGVVKELEKSFSEGLKRASAEFKIYLDELKKISEKSQNDTQSYMQSRVNQILDKFETNLADFLTQTEQKSISSIELELKGARNLIDTYKTQQLTLIDENIIAMLEKTLSLVITKKLTLKDQVDLVYEALEKAKVEKFIV